MTHFAAALAFLVAAALPARAAIEIVEIVSPGGIEAWFYEDRTAPILTIEASFLGGPVLDPEGREGAAAMMAGMLDQGAGALGAAEFARASEDLAARLSFSVGRDAVSVSATMLEENRDATLDLFRLALHEPRFDTDAVERDRQRRIAALRRAENDPRSLASRAYYAAAFPGHPLGRPVEGTVESVEALTAEDLRAAHRATLTLDRLEVAVVGAATAEEVGALLDRVFGGLPENGAPLPPVAAPALDGGVTVIDFDAPQTVARFGQPGIAREDPDFLPAFVMNHVLGGGGFGSRLTEELRERRGLTYGVWTGLSPGHFGALFGGGFSTSNARAGEALELVRAGWARIAEEGVSEEELERAKRYLTGAYPLRFDGVQRIAAQLLGLKVQGFGTDYVNIRNDLVEAVTVEDVARVAERLVRPDLLTVVLVGRPEGVAEANLP